MSNYYRRMTGPIYSYFNRNNNPIGPIDDSWLYSDYRNPTIRRPRLEWDGPQPSRQNAIHAGLFNEFSKNRDVASPAFVDEFITVPQEYDDDYNYFTQQFRSGPKTGYYAKTTGRSTAKETDEYLTGTPNEISEACSQMGSTLPQVLASYGLKGLLAGGLVAGTAYGGYKLYNWWKNKKPESQVPVEAGVSVTSKELSNNVESTKPTNITFNSADAETKAKIRRLARFSY